MSPFQVRSEQPGEEAAIAGVIDAAFGQADESRIIGAIPGRDTRIFPLLPSMAPSLLREPCAQESTLPASRSSGRCIDCSTLLT